MCAQPKPFIHHFQTRVYHAAKITLTPEDRAHELIKVYSAGIFLALIALVSASQNSHASPGITKGFCYTDASAPILYITRIFDVNTEARSISTLPLNNAFYNYLVEQYDYKNKSNYAAGCSVFETPNQAEARRSQLIVDAQRANKQVVEVNWDPGPVGEVAKVGGAIVLGPKTPPPTHTVCAVGHESTMYFSAVFDTSGGLVDPKWSDAFNGFLRKTYSAEGLVNCTTLNTLREAQALLKARIDGVRTQRHKAVETGWRFDASLPLAVGRGTPSQNTPLKVVDDDDPPPVPAPKTPPPSAPSLRARDFAAKETTETLALCQNNRMMEGAFDCQCLARQIYTYRVAHAADTVSATPLPVASFFEGDKFDCAGCIAQFVNAWARSRAQSAGRPLTAAQCAADKFEKQLRAKPVRTA